MDISSQSETREAAPDPPSGDRNSVAVKLSDGKMWRLARPTFRPRPEGLTVPMVDGPLEEIFEHIALDEPIPLPTIWSAAWNLLVEPEGLTNSNRSELLTVDPGAEASNLADAVVEAIFGPQGAERGYCDWVRASLLANGLSAIDIPANDLPNVLAILVSTNRTVPLPQFADVCRVHRERSLLDTLV